VCRTRQLQQLRQPIAGNAFVGVGPLHVNPLQKFCDRYRVAQSSHIAGDRAITQRNQGLGALPNLLDVVCICLRTDSSLQQRHVNIFWKLLRVYQRAVNDLDLAQDGNNGSVQIEYRHVAARAAIQPDGSQPEFPHAFAPPR